MVRWTSTIGDFMIRTVFAFSFCTLACVALAADGVPTPADNASSVLVNTAAAPTAAAPTAAACRETAKEVRLGRLQVLRLQRQADRQEARECCKCECRKEKDCRPTALVVSRTRPACCCNCK